MRACAIAAVVAGVTVLGFAAPALASPTSAPAANGATKKAACVAAIDVRLVEITKLQAALSGAKHLADAHAEAEHATLGLGGDGLRDLRVKIGADTDPTVLKQDCDSIYAGFRIFALRAPQAQLVIADDTETFAVERLQGVVPKLSAAIARAKAEGDDTTTAAALLIDMQAKLSDAAAQSAGVADAIIGYGPADWNANHSLLDPGRGKVKAAGADLRTASADAKGIVASLKDHGAKS